MNIKMLETVEDSHPHINEDPDTGKHSTGYLVLVLQKGQTYDLSAEDPAWASRCDKLIKMGHAEAV